MNRRLAWVLILLTLGLHPTVRAQDAPQDPRELADAGKWAEAETAIARIEAQRGLSPEELDLALRISTRLNHWDRVVALLRGQEKGDGLTVSQRVSLSEALLRLGDSAGAESVLARLVADSPDDENLSHQLAFLYLTQGRYEDGAVVYSRFLRNHPRAIESRINLALIEFAMERTESGLTHLGRAFEAGFDQANEYFYRQLVRNMPPEGLAQLAEDIKRELQLPQDGPAAHRFLAVEYENLARYQSAISSYEAYLVAESDDEARYRLARLYFLAGDLANSDRLVGQLIAAGGSQSHPARLLGAELAVRSGKFDRAAELLAGLAAAQRESAAYSYVAGRIALNNEEFGEAETRLTEALKRNPEFAEAYFHLGQLFLRTSRIEKGRRMLAEFQSRKP